MEVIGGRYFGSAYFRTNEDFQKNEKFKDLGIEVKDEEEVEEELIPFSFKLDHLTAYNPASGKDRVVVRLLNGENFMISANFDDFDDLMAAVEMEKDWKPPTLWERFKWKIEDLFKNKGKI